MSLLVLTIVGIVLVASQGTTSVGDLPFPTRESERRTGALRARALIADTRGLTPEALGWQPAPGMNTIGMLLAHCLV